MVKIILAIGLLFFYVIDLLSGGSLSNHVQRTSNWVGNKLEHRGVTSRQREPNMDDEVINNINAAIDERRKSLYQRYK
ncbi:hypothetical protein M5X11_08020 [Paenibacillus alginolyticus]|uniref:hypothetical protein n=1 Tax=Paenibacillus alginolyticus TaxID=59839 RepID=UPI00041025A6|nr:hypothetical protein [Paenibacillus alginolyticus]MCY9664903.1 hypothetical protein [Paenibacillus alginolyticus]